MATKEAGDGDGDYRRDYFAHGRGGWDWLRCGGQSPASEVDSLSGAGQIARLPRTRIEPVDNICSPGGRSNAGSRELPIW